MADRAQTTTNKPGQCGPNPMGQKPASGAKICNLGYEAYRKIEERPGPSAKDFNNRCDAHIKREGKVE